MVVLATSHLGVWRVHICRDVTEDRLNRLLAKVDESLLAIVAIRAKTD